MAPFIYASKSKSLAEEDLLLCLGDDWSAIEKLVHNVSSYFGSQTTEQSRYKQFVNSCQIKVQSSDVTVGK